MYKEVNPAVFACVTFPFLFGVMFGDIGHGGLLLIAGILLVLFNGAIKQTSMSMASELRYLVLLMGVFAFYNGWIYNEFFAIPMEVFGSCYEEEASIINWSTESPVYGWRRIKMEGATGASSDPMCVYTAGMDPRWF
jgi:V-type H+-transporting ATPase subunit a